MNRAELVKTLELVKPALAATNMVPIFQCFTFTNNGAVSAYDDCIAIVGPSELEENCAIFGNTLLGLLSNSKAEEVEFNLDKTTATIKLGKTVSKLPYDPEENFIFKRPDDEWASKINFSESLAEAFTICLETVSSDTTQAALLGITMQGNKMYSCNGDALTCVQLKNGVKGRMLLSTQFCSAILKLWSTLKITKGTLYFNDEWAFADFGDWEVYGRIPTIQDKIDFDALLKKTIKADTPVQAVPDDFGEALSRARVLADAESQKTVLTIAKGRLQMLTETHMGEIRDDLPLKGHPDVRANINASHLQKAIQYCDLIAFHDNCTVLERKPDVLLLVSNMA